MKEKVKNKQPLRVIPLGGLNEIGKNMTVYETGEDIIIVDCGLEFPEDELLGIDVVIPDMSYIIKNAERVRALFVTHSHEDHIGGIPYLLKEIDVPIYATRFTVGLIESKLKEHRLKPKIHVVKAGEKVKIGSFTVSPISVNHSTPDAVGYAITTSLGTVITTGDFKIDHTPIDGKRMQLETFAAYGNKGLLALLADSTNATHPGYTMSERSVGATFEELFRHADSRIVVASFASNVHRIQQIIDAAVLVNRKVTFSGRSMLNVSKVATELGYLSIPKNHMIDIKDIHRYPDNELVVITTGSQGEPMSALTRMANSAHRNMDIQKGDLVIFSSSPIPGNEKAVYRIINQLIQKGAEVIYESLEEVHVSGHAKVEELKVIHSLCRPRFFIPVHGEYLHLNAHKNIALSMGMKEEDIFILENGSVLEFTESGACVTGQVTADRVFVDGLGIGDVGSAVLRDRKHLSEDGLIIIGLAVDEASHRVISSPEIVSRGFVYVKESEALLNSAAQVVDKVIQSFEIQEKSDWYALRTALRDTLGQFIYKETKRSPMILPVFIKADLS